MFDLTITFDQDQYADGDQARLTGGAVDGRHIVVDEVRWTASEAGSFTIDGTSVTATARSQLGHLMVRTSDSDGLEAVTTVGVPIRRAIRPAHGHQQAIGGR